MGEDAIRDLIKDAIIPMMKQCGNSYANAWLEKWLTAAKEAGAYQGEVIGNVSDLIEAEQSRISENMPTCPLCYRTDEHNHNI